MTDNELKLEGIKALSDNLGELNTERFISIILREPFDYTKWQKDLLKDKKVSQISQDAMINRKNKY